MAIAALLPGTVCVLLLAPVSENWSCFTPEPPELSVAVRVTVTVVVFHPFALGLGDTEAVVVGGMVSPATTGIVTVAVPVPPSLSAARNVTTYVPELVGVKLRLAPEPEAND